ncbi:PREDICTED: uncharacterized protein LOC109210447 [Nicotiana attenuata]|uniref:uncharacterized protein LOC109210447 n=1 Tax=Nicotiana attenuata TaxID=49451 RepID=UPI0009056E14|nr:PREDICTED: uncharacterized protein LOC109210447 [Nicotiana attenuata]
MNIVLGLPQTQKKFDVVWVIMDRLTKSAHFIPVVTIYSSEQLAQIYIRKIVRLHGVPISIISDWGTLLTSHFCRAVHPSSALTTSSGIEQVKMSGSVNKVENDRLEDHGENGITIPAAGAPLQDPDNTPGPILLDADSQDAQQVNETSHTDKSAQQLAITQLQSHPRAPNVAAPEIASPDECTAAHACTKKNSDFQDDPATETYADVIEAATAETDKSEAEQRKEETQEVASCSLVGRMRSHPVSGEQKTLAFAWGLNRAYPPIPGRFKRRLARYQAETWPCIRIQHRLLIGAMSDHPKTFAEIANLSMPSTKKLMPNGWRYRPRAANGRNASRSNLPRNGRGIVRGRHPRGTSSRQTSSGKVRAQHCYAKYPSHHKRNREC